LASISNTLALGWTTPHEVYQAAVVAMAAT